MKTTDRNTWTSWTKSMLFLIIAVMVFAGCNDGGGGYDDDGDVNQPPTASISASVNDGTSPLVVTFDGSVSSDPDGDALSFKWDLGDGTPAANEHGTTSHTYTTPGSYTALLTVTDPSGESDTASIGITVRSPDPQQVSVPNLVNMTQSNAQTAIVAATLTVGTVTNEHSASILAESIISQTPASGTLVDTGTVVDLVVSLGPVMINVPNVVDLTQVAATTALTNAGLFVGTMSNQNSNTVPAGSVISQDPNAGISVATGSSVDLVVSSGPAMVTVPDVVGQSLVNAENAITTAGLVVGNTTYEKNGTVPAGSVISQNPTAGTSAASGSAVTLVISQGPSGTLPPDPATVAPQLDLTVATTLAAATSFLYTGATPIQTGMALDTINPVRAAVIRGKVMDRSNAPLSGVIITILNHPEFGQTLSREDGRFDLAINGGGYLTVNYEKNDYLPVQRQVDVPWQDYAHTPDVVMIGLDPNVTEIDLTLPNIQVARGSQETDSDGDRQATMLFMPGTTAELVLPDGSIQPMNTLNIRATEYTVGDNGPEAMPAELPPNSAYTYAVELSADEALSAGAVEVRFNQPIYTYVENFIGAPVGTAVPTGYYNRIQGQWVASENGRVIEVLDVAAGIAMLDIDGNGDENDAVELAELGITAGEQERISTLYATGQTLWRVPMTHLTPWDHNWPYGPPLDAVPPNGGDPKTKNGDPEDKPCIGNGSIIECQNQILGERIPIVGTSFSLNYRSDRDSGPSVIEIPVTGDFVPPSLTAVTITINVAGQVMYKYYLGAEVVPNLNYMFTWDGLDVYGRMVQGKQRFSIGILYHYPAIYYPVRSDLSNSFNRVQGASNDTGVSFFARPNLMRVDMGSKWIGYIGNWKNISDGLGGWSLSPHHGYSPLEKKLYLGNGDKRSAINIHGTIDTVAGGGTNNPGDGGLATEVQLRGPYGVACDQDGSFYISETLLSRIHKVDRDGIITTVAGNGTAGFSGDGALAVDAQLQYPSGIAVGRDGSIYIADRDNDRVRKVDQDGIITTVAGNGTTGFSGDGGLATEASLDCPFDVALSPDGSIYIVDRNNDRVRRVGLDGIISTVAGMDYGGWIGDGELATETYIQPFAIDVAADGSIYIAQDSYAQKIIWKVGIDGIITIVAGGYHIGSIPLGDGGLATDAELSNPYGVAVGADGSIYIADRSHFRIRKVDSDGIITTIAGNGSGGYSSGDGGLATDAVIGSAYEITLGPDGQLYIADPDNHRIRNLKNTLPTFSLTDLAIASADGREFYHFDTNGRHLRTLDSLNGEVRYDFRYDSSGHLVEIEDRYGLITTIERDGNGIATAIVAPFGQRTTLQMDSNGFLAGIANPAFEQIVLTNDYNGLLASMVYPEGGTSLFTYDEFGLLIKDEDPLGGIQTFSRSEDETGYTVTRTTDMGRVTTFRMEDVPTGERFSLKQYPDGTWNKAEFGLKGDQTTTYSDGTVVIMKHGPDPRFGMQSPVLESLEITSPDGLTNSIVQTRSVLLEKPDDVLSLQTLEDNVNVNGRTFVYHYDATTRVLSTTTPEGRVSQNTLDEQGRVISIDMGDGVDPVTITYDGSGRVSAAAQGGQSWSYTYDKYRIVSRTDAAGKQMFFTYDDADRMTQMQLPEGEAVGYAYDENGNRTQVIMPSTQAHTLDYTLRNQLQSYVPPDNLGLTYEYDLDKSLTETTLASGKTITNTFDEKGLWTDTIYPAATVASTYPLDCNKLETMTRTPTNGGTAQEVSYSYDGKLITGISYSGVAVGDYTYIYDSNLFLKQMDLSSGLDAVQIPISRDNDGLITGYGSFSLTRNGPDGTVNQISDGVLNIAVTYDTLGRVESRTTTVDGMLVYAYALTRDNVGKIIQNMETFPSGSVTYLYMYDDNIQLTNVMQGETQVEAYTYDENGNRLTTLSATASYDVQDRIISFGGINYQFDVDGYLTGRGDDSFEYSVRGELLEVSMGDGTVITYAYDGHRRRVGRTDVTGTYQYLYGNPYNSFQITAIRAPSGDLSTLYYNAKGLFFAMDRGSHRYYIATDQVGTPRVITDSSGNVVKTVEYNGFGQVTSDSNTDFDMPIGFAGGLADPASGLVRFGLRDYDPMAGRWTARDPILFDGGQANLYVYVGNNPVGLRDPFGLWCVGASAYVGLGAGAELCCSNGRCSVCGEAGFGAGGSISVGSGGAKKTGNNIIADAEAGCGPLKIGANCAYNYKCGVKCGANASAGPYKIDSSGDVQASASDFETGCKAEAKLAAQTCFEF